MLKMLGRVKRVLIASEQNDPGIEREQIGGNKNQAIAVLIGFVLLEVA